MNIVYQVTLISEIEIDFKKNLDNLIDATVAENDLLVIDATGSYFKGNERDGSKGLAYRWECSAEIQTYCDQWAGSPVMKIHKDIIKGANLINQDVEITVVVFAIEASSSGKEFPDLEFKKTETFIWSNTLQPRFNIIFPKHDRGNVLLVSKA